MITTRQKWLIAGIIFIMAFDAIISLDGAWNHNATFYEANPLLAATKTIVPFTIAVIAGKTLAVILFVWGVSTLNKSPGIKWGNAAATIGLLVCSIPIMALCLINIL